MATGATGIFNNLFRTRESRPLPLEAPVDEVTLDMPDFISKEPLVSLSDKQVAVLDMPDFYIYPTPVASKASDIPLDLPNFTIEPPVSALSNSRPSLGMPRFNRFELPREIPLQKSNLTVPVFSPFKQPVSLNQRAPDPSLPSFTLFQNPEQTISVSSAIPMPAFLPFTNPSQNPTAPQSPILLPHFDPFQMPPSQPLVPPSSHVPVFAPFKPPAVRNPYKKPPKTPRITAEFHPVMKKFDRLAKLKSYDDIVREAINLDSLNDARMLRHHSILRHKYVKSLFDHLMHSTPSLLPQSSQFRILLENDQDQLDLFAKFCTDLIGISDLNDLKLKPHEIIDRLLSVLRPIPSDEHLLQQKALLQIKDFIYCFFSAILLQEKKAAQKFTVSQKDLTKLSASLPLLAAHIQESTDAQRMFLIRTATALNFAPWEDRTPVKTEIIELDSGKVPDNFDIEKGLKEIQVEKPESYQLIDYTNAATQQPNATAEEAYKKAGYFLALGRIYFKLKTITALQRTIFWIDQAINTLDQHDDKDITRYHECYEFRGAVWLKMAQLISPISTQEDTLSRKRIDISSRDFFRSLPLENNHEKNFIRTGQSSKQDPDLDKSAAGLADAIQVDQDYAEARFVRLLKQLDKLHMDENQLLHPFFYALRGASPVKVFEAFKTLLLKKAYSETELKKKNQLCEKATLFKVALGSGTVVVQITPEGVAVNRAGKDIWVELLTKGVKHVEVLHSPTETYYFSPPISSESFWETVQSLKDHQKRLQSMEREVQEFHDFEMASLYKSTLLMEKEALKSDTIRSRLDPLLFKQLIDIESMIAQGYFHLGKTTKSQEHYATALSYICRAISDTEYLLRLFPNNKELKTKKLALLLRRASVYKSLKLWNCYAEALEESIGCGKIDNPRFLNPSLNYALGLVYTELDRFADAEDQYYIVLGSKKNRNLIKKADVRLKKLKLLKLAKKEGISTEKEDAEAIAQFQDNNIREECLQILHDNAYVNAQGEPYRRVALWNEFSKKIQQTTTIKQFCEVIFASVLPSDKVKYENLLRLAKISNITIQNLTHLDQIKAYLLDAIKTYEAQEAELQDQAVKTHVKAVAVASQAKAFYAFKKQLIERFKEGELIRPESQSRQKIFNLSAQIKLHEDDSNFVLEALSAIIGGKVIPADLKLIKEDIAEISALLESVLELDRPPTHVEGNVLHITGRNIFLSQVKSTIEATCSGRKDIHDIHIVGVNVYIDSSLAFKGFNLAIGGEYVEFIKDNRGNPLTIDLSGTEGNSGVNRFIDKANNARHNSEPGRDGISGADGEGGQSGGDFCVGSDVLVGLSSAIIQKVDLNGGTGGPGCDGQDAGDGAKSIPGVNAIPDPSKYEWGHIDLKRGGKATPGTEGGQGGDAGLGGKGGNAGHFLIEKKDHGITVQTDDGKDGGNGNYGKGGKGDEGAADGLDHVKVKGGGWIFSSSDSKSGFGLDCKNGSDRDIKNWHDTITVAEMKSRTQRNSRGRGKSAEEQSRQRKSHTKNHLKRELLKTRLSRHLHTEGSAGKGYAFDNVTNRLAVAEETEKVLAEQLEVKQRKMKDIDTLYQTTATLLSQAQTQQTAQTQHTRVAAFSRKEQRVNQKKEILGFLQHKESDLENLLPFQEYSPVRRKNALEIHEIDYAIHKVNMSQGRHMPAIAELIRTLAKYSKKAEVIQDKKDLLIQRLTSIILTAPLKHAIHGFDQLILACEDLDPLIQIIQSKKKDVDRFDKIIEKESGGIKQAYQFKILNLTTLRAILHFIGSDRLLFRLLVKKMDPAERIEKEKWFKHRLRQKIVEIAKNTSSTYAIDSFVEYAEAKIDLICKELEDKKLEFPSLALASVVSSHRKELQQELKILRQNQDWLLGHLPELIEAEIFPTVVLIEALKKGDGLKELYESCSQKWANSPTLQPEAPPAAEESEEALSPSTMKQQFDRSVDKTWDLHKQSLFESHLKQLVDLGAGEEHLDQLKKLYTNFTDFKELAEIFIFLTQRHEKASLEAWGSLLPKLQLSDPSQIYAQRKHFWNITDRKDELLFRKIQSYLQKRHLSLITLECKHVLPQDFHPFLIDFLAKALALFNFRDVLPDVDFLECAKRVIADNAEIIRSTSASAIPLDIALQLTLKKAVDGVLGLVDLIPDHKSNLLEQFNTVLQRSNFPKAGAFLFLLLNLDLSYDKAVSLLKSLEKSPIPEEPMVKYGLLLLSQRINEQKIMFDSQWKAVIQRAQIYDRMRQQIAKDDQNSIEKTLLEIAAEADLLPSDEKVAVLNRLIRILTKEGCFTSFLALKHFQLELIRKLGIFPTVPYFNESFNGLLFLSQRIYEQKIVFDSQWMEVVQRARIYDRMRQQIAKDDQSSIEKTLFEIAAEADLLPSDEKVAVLNQLIRILTKEGCFTSLSALKHFQLKLDRKLEVFTTVLYYNEAFKRAFASENDDRSGLPALFLTIISKSKFSAYFLATTLIAIHHLPWNTHELTALFKWIEQWEGKEQTDIEIKERCLSLIREHLIQNLRSRCQTSFQLQQKAANELLQKQVELVKKIGSVIKSTSVFSPDHQIAKFQLWLKLLDLHYATDKHGDSNGVLRQKHYDEAYNCFLEKMKKPDIQNGIDEFNRWLGDEFNRLKSSPANLTILDHLEEVRGQTPEHTLEIFKSLFWRGAITYPLALERLKDKRLSEETAKRLKLKLDDGMIHEEYSEIKFKMEKYQKKYEEAFTAWIDFIEASLSTGQEIERNYPSDGVLNAAIDGRVIPHYNPPHKKSEPQADLTIDEWLEPLLPKQLLSPDNKIALEKGVPKVKAFLKDLAARFEDEEIEQDDAATLKTLKTIFERWEGKKSAEIQEKVKKLELKLIGIQDRKTDEKKAKIDEFLDLVVYPNRSELKDSRDIIHQQKVKDLERLKAALSSCSFLMGEDLFLALLDKLIRFLKKDHDQLSLPSLVNLFWAVPRLNSPGIIFEVIDKKLPENWSLLLLEIYCHEALSPSLERMTVALPSIDLSKLDNEKKDEEINKILQQNKKRQDDCLVFFKASLTTILTAKLRQKEKEILLRLISERLELLNQGKLQFPIEEFVSLLAKYMADPDTLRKISAELSKIHSVIANTLFLPSYQSFKYALTRAWIAGVLEPVPNSPILQHLSREDHQKIYDSLFEIETVKKEEIMRKVVDSLRGDIMTPAVAECVAHFADGTWELDEMTLQTLKERTKSGKWYDEIEQYTKKIRSKGRDLKTLIGIMAKESTGINNSIKELIEGEEPELVKIIEKIQDKFKSGIAKWSEKDITEWANRERSEAFPHNLEQLMEGIAVLSRAYQLASKDHYTLRETQMIALWLMLRPAQGIENGRISQMFTGEGKSITFAGLAILRAMSNSCVDVVTTSVILAERDAKENEELFKLFDMTVSNNCDDECEKSEEVRKSRYYRNGKSVDIVYGDVGSFERDLLLTEFHGQEIIHEKRMGSNRSVLVDEVDGLFLDNAGMVLYLSHSVDTLRFLERLFGHIWAMANHAAFEKARHFDDKAVEEMAKIIKSKIESDEIPLPLYKITNARYVEMKAVIQRKLPIWIRSALHAKALRVNDEYIIADQVYGGKKKKTVTVMDKGTGAEQYSLKWSNGLHQFLQFKHGLELTPESLKAVFLSNYFFFKRYKQHIYGLSGTLGSDTEQKYLQSLYKVDLCKIPRFKGEKYIQYKAVVAGDKEEWIKRIESGVERQLKENKRAVLIICDSVAEVMILQQQFKQEYPLLHIYTSITQTQEIPFFAYNNPALVGPGDLIIATNLAGRGTDLKTDPSLEEHGGLHVVVSYLPPNIRIQEQGFGRTGRSGNEGSGELIVMDPHRRPITELSRIRDMEEKQRLEDVATRDVKKIEFENELLRGLVHDGETIEGFQALLDWVKEELKLEEPFYREAQINSLKNRWAFWIDHMEEKITIVHAIGKEIVLASFKEFLQGVRNDFKRSRFRLIHEPIELIKLGGDYRRQEKWSEAEACYQEAANDPHYRYALYYKAACKLIKAPSSSATAKEEFKTDAKKAALAIKPEIAQLQMTLQNVSPIVEQTRLKGGAADYGNPYKARTEERIQVWSIFLSAIDEALGGPLTEELIKKSQYGENAGKILADLRGSYRPAARLSNKLTFKDDTVVYSNKKLEVEKEFTVPKMLRPVLGRLRGINNITKQELKAECKQALLTREKAEKLLKCSKIPVFKFKPLPTGFKWPPGYEENVQFVLSTVVEELQFDPYRTPQDMKSKLEEKKSTHKLLRDKNIDINLFFKALEGGNQIGKDFSIDLMGMYVKNPPLTFESTRDLKLEDLKAGFTDRFRSLEDDLQEAIFSACRQREIQDGKSIWSLKPSIYLSELSLPATSDEAVEMLWNIFEDQQVTKVPKVKLDKTIGHFKEQLENIKKTVEVAFKDHPEADEALKSIYNIIDSSVGMIYKLDDKKTTAKFAEIIRKYYHDHQQHAPEGLGFFIELGLEVIADLIEKKDPPAWFEVLAVTVMGVIQMVAGVIIKAYLPLVGDLIGNALISSGMDDVMFAVNSAITGEFSWSDYGEHKVASLKRSIISSAISCGVSFGVDAANAGITKAAHVQQLSGVQKAAEAGHLASGGFNLGSHIVNEIGRNFITMGISQVASRGLEGMTKLIAGSYDQKVRENIEASVHEHWITVVEPQAKALYDKLAGDATAQTKIEGCVNTLIESTKAGNFFDGAIRGSRQVLPQARNMIKDKGWGTFISFVPDIANLGISLAKLTTLVKDNVHQLARDIRNTNERNTQAANAPNRVSEDAFKVHLGKLKTNYTEQLTLIFTGVLNSAVYAPLVSLGTKALVEAGSNIIPLTEQEAIAQSSETLADILEAEENADEAFYDKALRNWRKANQEVVDLSEAELQKSPINCPESIEALKNQYGSLLKIYKDKDGNLYAQRPNRADYIQAVKNGKASGDPEIAALAKVAGKKIAIVNPEGKVKIYAYDQQNKKVSVKDDQDSSDRSAADTIFLKYEPNSETGIGHVTLEGTDSGSNPTLFDGDNCLYDAVSARDPFKRSPAELRNTAVNTLETDEDFKRYYHDWSLSNEPKTFAGAAPYNIGTRLHAALNGTFALGEFVLGAGLTLETGGLAAATGIPLMVHGADNFNAAWNTFICGQKVDATTTQIFQSGLNISHESAELLNDAVGMFGTLGGTFVQQSAKMASAGLKFETTFLTDLLADESGTFGKQSEKTAAAGLKVDWIAGETGVSIPGNLKAFEAMMKKFAVSIEPTKGSPGMQYILKNGISARVMKPNGPNNPHLRASFEKIVNGKSSPINPFTGKPPSNPPRGFTGNKTEYARKRTHIIFDLNE